ncbi:hypothetical protein GCM10010174_81350 [Kutzneria viridogrisea]|uniref:Helix-turn-helix domain-containing protein n=2 Tax=Kutzneria TaxID=43356 RepID=W5WGP0_9PSEU|nr:helix-turn-helix domain-containing protein [Kutzneria albida]AHI00023.1 hypothetical protein KALB_6663 [Kutzneria albida DSM 43870]MBA8925202.1 excisionase family DNA binding protein [Kutzneria viridogrisea]
MTVSLERQSHTVLPPAADDTTARPRLHALASLLGNAGQDVPAVPALVGPDGVPVELPDAVYQVLRSVVDAMAQGLAITVAPHNTLLTTQEAAEVLSISRPTLVRLLESGEIPFEHRGRHRRVRLADVMDYQEQARAKRRQALRELTQDAEQADLGDAAERIVRTR